MTNNVEMAPEALTIHGGVDGIIRLMELPTADPEVFNALWNDGGTLKISNGP